MVRFDSDGIIFLERKKNKQYGKEHAQVHFMVNRVKRIETSTGGSFSQISFKLNTRASHTHSQCPVEGRSLALWLDPFRTHSAQCLGHQALEEKKTVSNWKLFNCASAFPLQLLFFLLVEKLERRIRWCLPIGECEPIVVWCGWIQVCSTH